MTENDEYKALQDALKDSLYPPKNPAEPLHFMDVALGFRSFLINPSYLGLAEKILRLTRPNSPNHALRRVFNADDAFTIYNIAVRGEGYRNPDGSPQEFLAHKILELVEEDRKMGCGVNPNYIHDSFKIALNHFDPSEAFRHFKATELSPYHRERFTGADVARLFTIAHDKKYTRLTEKIVESLRRSTPELQRDFAAHCQYSVDLSNDNQQMNGVRQNATASCTLT